MRQSPAIVIAVVLCAAASPVRAAGPEVAALDRLSAINGLALHCKRTKEAGKIKRAITDVVPKTREYGDKFEKGTTKAFLEASRTKALCPPRSEFNAQVSEAIERLKQAFGE